MTRYVVDKFSAGRHLPKQGLALDIGCGCGDFFRHFHEQFPHWVLYGLDIGEQFRNEVKSIEGVAGFFSSLSQIDPQIQFDLITINYVLSLANNATEILQFVHDHLKIDGRFYLADTDINIQPWDLYFIETQIALNMNTIKNLLSYYGFDIIENIFSENKKNFGLICRKINDTASVKKIYNENLRDYNQAILFMDKVYEVVRTQIVKYDNIGIWGTSIGGLFVFQMIKDICPTKDLFFIDEVLDLNDKYGVPIFKPSDINVSACVFLPFPNYIAKDIMERMKKNGLMTSCRLISFYDYLFNEV